MLKAIRIVGLAAAFAAGQGDLRAGGQERAAPTYYQDVAPILQARCAGCHRPDGDAPFSLVTFEEARGRAAQIAAVTRSRYMPPWKPEPGYGDFEGGRRLTDRELLVLDRWIAAGLPEGTPAAQPAPAWSGGWQLGEPDLIVPLPEYALRAEGPDVFRNFVVRVPGRGTRHVSALQFRPGGRAVHHANIRVDPTTASRQLDAADPGPGYEGLILHSAEYPDGHFLGWTPGQAPSAASSDLAWRLEEGADFVVQLHMQPTGRIERLTPAIGLYFSAGPPARTPAIIRLGRQTLDIPAGAERHVVDDEYELPVDVEVHAIQPHAHYRARDVRAVADLPGGGRRELLWIRNWDFNWQDRYRYRAPFWLPAGTRIAVKYEFDNSEGNPRNPRRPPERARWGWRSFDEMGDVWIQVLTRSDADRRRLVADARRKMLAEDAAGSELLIEREPAHASLRNDAALIYMELGRPLDALKHFETVSRLDPRSAVARYNEGVALEGANRPEQAAGRYEAALRLDPQYALAHTNLGTLRLGQGRADDALRHYRRAVDLSPADAQARNNLGGLLVAIGDVEEAVGHLRRALDLRPGLADAHFNLGRAHTRAGRAREALASYRAALDARPDWAACLTNLAWLLAAHPDPGLRDPAEAVRAAERAVGATRQQDAAALDVLAVAYAADGRFAEAIVTADRAVAAARNARLPSLAAEIRQRLALYRQGRPFLLR